MNYDYTGKIDKIMPTEQVSERFRKRLLWLYNAPTSDTYDNSVYTQFEATQNNCGKLDMFKVGDVVTVTFSLRGRKYKNKATGEDGVYTSLHMKDIQIVESPSPQPRDITNDFESVPF